MHDLTSYYGASVPSSNQKVWSFGGTYEVGAARLYLGYTNNKLDPANYKNQVVYAGIKYAFNGAWSATASGTYDWVKHNSASGNRFTGAVLLDYAFSKRTDVYLESDYTTLSGVWQAVAAPATFVTPMYGAKTRLGAMVGLRHKF